MWYYLLFCLPRRWLSRQVGSLTRLAWPSPVQRFINRTFVRLYGLDMSEAEFSVESYPSLNALFVRRLRIGARLTQREPVHPCDGLLTARGLIENATLLQAKGKLYGVGELLASEEVSDFEGGAFFTYYLCPRDYHRVHSPVSGDIVGARLVPGDLWPVHAKSVARIERLMAVNERLITRIWTSLGEVVVVMVGATNVGSITAAFDQRIRSNEAKMSLEGNGVFSYDPTIGIRAGKELGVFNFGSTVIVLYSKKYWASVGLARGFSSEASMASVQVQVGQSLIERQ